MGAWVFGGGLYPVDTASVVSAHTGKTVNKDGPFPEAKGQIGGFGSIAADDLDAALASAWAEKASAACSAQSKYGH